MRTLPVLATTALTLTLLLVGCTAASEPTTTPEPEPTGSETPQPVAAPGPALDLTCDELVPAASRELLLGEAGQPGSPAGPPAAMLLAERQAGATVCRWSVTRADGGISSLDVTVLADAQTDFARVRAETPAGTDVTSGEFGDDSVLGCGQSTCGFELLVGDAWVSGAVASPSITGGEAGRAAVTPLLQQLVAAVKQAPRSSEAWTPPEDAAKGWGWDCWTDAGGAPILNALDEAYGAQFGSMGSQIDTRFEAARVTEILSFCNAAADDYAVTATASFLEGGAWAAEDPSVMSALTAASVVEVPGTARAVVSCAQHCTAYLAVEGSLLIVEGAPEDVAAFQARLPQLVVAALA